MARKIFCDKCNREVSSDNVALFYYNLQDIPIGLDSNFPISDSKELCPVCLIDIVNFIHAKKEE